MIDLNGKVAIVTGATSGIGEETAKVLAKAGASVIATGRSEKAAKALVMTIQENDGKADWIVGDITDSQFTNNLVTTTEEKFGRLDILANVAGVITRGDALTTTDLDWFSVMNVNVTGTFFMSRASISAMRRSGGGSIINLGSTVGLTGCDGLLAYCASKGAVVNMTRAMAIDYATENIRVNSVNPGAVDTPMLVSGHGALNVESIREENRNSIPQGWLPQPKEVANLIAFLASDLSKHITGAAIPVDGGYTAE